MRVREILQPFDEPVYLHQVVERFPNGMLQTHSDLSAALERLEATMAEEWRIHFHVPIFLEDFGVMSSTHIDTKEVLALIAKTPITTHLEIETYTWSVLPEAHQSELVESIAREYDWVLAELGRSTVDARPVGT